MLKLCFSSEGSGKLTSKHDPAKGSSRSCSGPIPGAAQDSGKIRLTYNLFLPLLHSLTVSYKTCVTDTKTEYFLLGLIKWV